MTRPRSRIGDWQEVKERLARANVAPELSPAQAEELMARRARALSLPANEAGKTTGADFVVFSLAKERYAIEAQFVREVVKLKDLTPIPGTPEFLAGVTNLHGAVLLVVDLRRFLDLPPGGLTDLSRLLVLGTERAEFGILADEAQAVSSIGAEALTEPPESVAGVGREFLLGVTREALIVLNGRLLLSDPRLSAAASEASKA